jgi:hypothetical protein
MNDKDIDQTLERLLAEKEPPLADDGFTDGVMARITAAEETNKWRNIILAIFSTAAVLVSFLLIFLKGTWHEVVRRILNIPVQNLTDAKNTLIIMIVLAVITGSLLVVMKYLSKEEMLIEKL